MGVVYVPGAVQEKLEPMYMYTYEPCMMSTLAVAYLLDEYAERSQRHGFHLQEDTIIWMDCVHK